MLRPNLQEFFARVGKLYEVVIFTASLKKYANMIIDIIDKDKICKHRLFRDQCSYINNIYVKELKKLNRNMKNVVILDNNPNAFCLDFDNGIPIKSFFDDKSDKELLQMAYVLEKLAKVNDVRPYIKEIVDMNQINYDRAFEIFKHKDNNNSSEGSPLKSSAGLKGQLKIVKVEKIAQNAPPNSKIEKNNLNSKGNKIKSNTKKSSQYPNQNLNINNKLSLSSGKSFRSSAQRSISKEDNNNINNTPNKPSPFKMATHLNNNNNKDQRVKLIPNGSKIVNDHPTQKKKAKSSVIMNENSNRALSKGKRPKTSSKFNIGHPEISKRPKSVIPLKVNEIKNNKNYYTTSNNNQNSKLNKNSLNAQTSKEKKSQFERNKTKPLITSTSSSNNSRINHNNQYKKPGSFINARELTNQKDDLVYMGNLKNNNTSVNSSSTAICKNYSRQYSLKTRQKNKVPIPAKSERQKNITKNISSPPIGNPTNSSNNFSSSRSKSSSKSNLKTLNGKNPKVSKSSELKIVKVVPNVFHSIAKNIFSKTDLGSNSFKSFRTFKK